MLQALVPRQGRSRHCRLLDARRARVAIFLRETATIAVARIVMRPERTRRRDGRSQGGATPSTHLVTEARSCPLLPSVFSQLFFWAAGWLLLAPLLVVAPACMTEAPSADDDGGDDGGSSGDGGGSPLGPPSTTSGGPECSGEELTCIDAATVGACESGSFTPYACNEVCDYYGFYSEGCSADDCQCGDPNNYECLDGVSGLCACLEWADAGSCSNEDYNSYYGGCHQNDPDFAVVACFGHYVSGDTVDCEAAASACL